VLYQFSVGFFACLIFATTPRVAAHSDDKRLVRHSFPPGPGRCVEVYCQLAVHSEATCTLLGSPALQASRATAHGMWIALVVGLLLQAAVWAKAPAVVTCLHLMPMPRCACYSTAQLSAAQAGRSGVAGWQACA
jgi:hypothetical protein